MLFLAGEDASDGLADPRVDLQIAGLLRGQAELDAAIGANVSGLGEARAVFDGHPQQPFGGRPPADLTGFFIHLNYV